MSSQIIKMTMLASACFAITLSGDAFAGKIKKAKTTQPNAGSSRSQQVATGIVDTEKAEIVTSFNAAMKKITQALNHMPVLWSRLMPLIQGMAADKETKDGFAVYFERYVHGGAAYSNQQVFDNLVSLLNDLYQNHHLFVNIGSNVNQQILDSEPKLYFQMLLANLLTNYIEYDSITGSVVALNEYDTAQDPESEPEPRTYNNKLKKTVDIIRQALNDMFKKHPEYKLPEFNSQHMDLSSAVTMGYRFLEVAIDNNWFANYRWEDNNVSLAVYFNEFLIDFFNDEEIKRIINHNQTETAGEGEGMDVVMEGTVAAIFAGIEPPKTNSMSSFLSCLNGQFSGQSLRMDLAILLAFLKIDFSESSYEGLSGENQLLTLEILRKQFAQGVYEEYWKVADKALRYQIVNFFEFVLGFSFVGALEEGMQAEVASDLEALSEISIQTDPGGSVMPAINLLQAVVLDASQNTFLGIPQASGGVGFAPIPVRYRHMNQGSGGPGGGGASAGVVTASDNSGANRICLQLPAPTQSSARGRRTQNPGIGITLPQMGMPDLQPAQSVPGAETAPSGSINQFPFSAQNDQWGSQQQEPAVFDYPLNYNNVLLALNEEMSKWNDIGMVLGLPMSELERIKEENRRDVRSALREVVKVWFSQPGKKDWKDIIDAISSRIGGWNRAHAEEISNKVARAKKYKQIQSNSSAAGKMPELIDMIEALQDVSGQWFELGLQLGLTVGGLEEIAADNNTQRKRFVAMLNLATHQIIDLSWNDIVKSLVNLKEINAAAKIMDKYF